MRRRTRVRLGGAALGLVSLMLSGSAEADDPPKPLPVLQAHVTRVNDGDSIEVELDSAAKARVRMSAIDTPEFDQPYGSQASAALKAMLPVGSSVELEVVTQDAFHRMVATVWLIAEGKRVNLNEAMLREGHAWAYRRYMPDPKYCDIEQEARAKKAGLWAQPVSDWVYPPEWRFLKNGEIRMVPAPYEETREKCLAVSQRAGKGNYEPPK
jgi:micrococcal nuclease